MSETTSLQVFKGREKTACFPVFYNNQRRVVVEDYVTLASATNHQVAQLTPLNWKKAGLSQLPQAA